MVEHEFPITLGRDYAGVVEQVGADVTRFSVGDEVFGFIDEPDCARRHLDRAHRRPRERVDRSQARKRGARTAAAAPLTAITAMSAIDALAIGQGDAARHRRHAGGVGSIAVQLAAAARATVIAPALPEDEPYLRELEVADIMPRNGDLAVAVRRRYPDGVDALLDNVSYAPGAYDAALKDGARVASPNNAAGEGPGRTNLMAAPTSENLERLARLLDTGIVNVPIHQAYPLEQAPAR
jgi:NADPH:quinone reductase